MMIVTGNDVTTIPMAFIHANTLSRGILMTLLAEQQKAMYDAQVV